MNNTTGRKKLLMDEGYQTYPLSEEAKEQMRKIRILTNQHLLNEDKTDLKPTATLNQSINKESAIQIGKLQITEELLTNTTKYTSRSNTMNKERELIMKETLEGYIFPNRDGGFMVDTGSEEFSSSRIHSLEMWNGTEFIPTLKEEIQVPQMSGIKVKFKVSK